MSSLWYSKQRNSLLALGNCRGKTLKSGNNVKELNIHPTLLVYTIPQCNLIADEGKFLYGRIPANKCRRVKTSPFCNLSWNADLGSGLQRLQKVWGKKQMENLKTDGSGWQHLNPVTNLSDTEGYSQTKWALQSDTAESSYHHIWGTLTKKPES